MTSFDLPRKALSHFPRRFDRAVDTHSRESSSDHTNTTVTFRQRFQSLAKFANCSEMAWRDLRNAITMDMRARLDRRGKFRVWEM